MNLSSLFKKRNYIFLYHKLKPCTNSVNKPEDYSGYHSLAALSEYFNLEGFNKIVVVASGPSAANILLEDDALYLCCNDSINIVKSKPHVYVVHDPFYLTKYLKSFKQTDKWFGTLFWIYNNNSKINYQSFDLTQSYITNRSRKKKEFLITNFDYCDSSKKLNSELIETLKDDFDFSYQSINSGFNTLLIASVLAFKNNKELKIYGLDMGVGGDKYYNKKAFIGKSIKDDVNRNIVSDFLSKLYKKNMKITNESNFMHYKNIE
ncbi:hypothetical protein [Flavobacterium notoginsengisoli]|uniref:hypothetical protein n=1 Tax=Flavobacterium notoginsengisoli TaxID=1478199 RepID=UPI00363C9BA8